MRTISKPLFLPLLFLLAAAWGALDAHAAMIPQEWSVEVSRIKQYQFQANRGDTMELKATFWHKGEPFDLGGDTFRLYWQTNGMDRVYWSVPAVSASNTVSAVFANTMDPGAPIVYGFLGATSGNYRASFAIRYAPGPGAVPNALPLPVSTIDFSKVVAVNAPWLLPGATNDIGTIKVELGSLSNSVSTLSAAAATINSKIPSAASASNQLADKEWIDDEIDTYAAYYITYTAAGAAFPTRAALLNATVVYSGGVARTPTRNDYAVVLSDEMHGGAEWRYIYTVAAGATSGQWDAQYPIETNDYDALSNKPKINGVSLSGNKTGADLGVLDLAGGTMIGGIYFGALDYYGYLGLAYDGENHRLLIIDSWNENIAYLEVPLAYDGDRVAFTRDISAAATAATNYTAAAALAATNYTDAAISPLKRDKADVSQIRYTLTNITYAAGVQLADRTNTSTTIAAPGSGNTATATFTMPAPTTGKARDFMLNLTFGSASTDAGDINLTFVEPTPAGGTAPSVEIDFGSIEDVAIGKNIILFTEVALPTSSPSATHWLITVKHEDFQ